MACKGQGKREGRKRRKVKRTALQIITSMVQRTQRSQTACYLLPEGDPEGPSGAKLCKLASRISITLKPAYLPRKNSSPNNKLPYFTWRRLPKVGSLPLYATADQAANDPNCPAVINQHIQVQHSQEFSYLECQATHPAPFRGAWPLPNTTCDPIPGM